MSTNKQPRGKLDLTGLTNSKGLSGLSAEANKDKILLLDPSEIETPEQVRRTFRNINELRATMDAEGQQSPIIVSPKKANGKYVLLKGGRRLKAASLEPAMKLKAIIDPTDYSAMEDEAVFSQLVENVQRDDLLPHEIGRGILKSRLLAKARGENKTNRMIAARMGKSETWVSLHVSLAELPDELTQLIEDEITRDADILHNLRNLSEINADVYKRVLAEANETLTLDRASVRDAVKLAKAIQAGELPPDATEFPKATAPVVAALPVVTAEAGAKAPGATTQQASTEGGSDAPAAPPQTVATDPAAKVEKLPHAGAPSQTDTGKTQAAAGQEMNQAESQAAGQKSPAGASNAGQQSQTDQSEEGGDRQAAKKQVNIQPEQMIIFVRVVFDQNAESGHLMTDRVCIDPNKVYVNIVDAAGRQATKLVPVDSVEIVSVSSRS